ncbi:hypothetical protein ARMGADRAFT_1048619 [Armillaria gallica]|uniref:ATP-dependent DNA helicase n=1 Tax=Armillaria gallica TaxID=47427 RepID=A0A2H3CH83_ARMGA|nr:hypothetical protein ARMGADRAFT_1048619 [Armillaria gallica]
MVSSKLLVQVSTALCLVKENQLAFGGLNIIFAGDFAQLLLIGDSKLFSQVEQVSGMESAQKMVQGKLLWLAVDTVVVLTQVMRQEGRENEVFVELLQQLRMGTCAPKDNEKLKHRLAKHVMPDWTSPQWRMAPLIISENAVKDAINRRVTEAFAECTGCRLHYYYAADSHCGSVIPDRLL